MSRTNEDLYQAIERLRLEIKADLKDVQIEVSDNTNWRNKIIGQFTILMIVIGAGVNWLFSLIPRKN